MDKMLRLGPSAQLLSRCSNGWLTMGVAPVRTGSPLYQSIRQVSTTRPKKAQATKEQVKVAKDTVKEAVEKKAKSTVAAAAKPRQVATKATAPSSSERLSTAAKAVKAAPKTQVPKSTSPTTSGKETKAAAPAPVKKTPAAKASPAAATTTTTTTRAPKAATTTPAAKAPGQATSSHTPTPTSTPRPTAGNTKPGTTPSPAVATGPAKSAPTQASKSSPVSAPLPYSARVAKPAEPEPKRPVDTSSPEYKRTARKWVQAMIALPILLVTSYFLYDRLALGNHPSLEPYRRRLQPAAVASEGAEAHKV